MESLLHLYRVASRIITLPVWGVEQELIVVERSTLLREPSDLYLFICYRHECRSRIPVVDLLIICLDCDLSRFDRERSLRIRVCRILIIRIIQISNACSVISRIYRRPVLY